MKAYTARKTQSNRQTEGVGNIKRDTNAYSYKHTDAHTEEMRGGRGEGEK